MITGLSHLCLVAHDLEASVDFYVDGLGLRHGFDFMNDDGERTGVYLYFGNRTFVEIFKASGDFAEGPRSYKHMCIEVDDLAETITELRGRGIELTDSKLGSDGNPQAWTADPDGNQIELMELRPDGLQVEAIERLDDAK